MPWSAKQLWSSLLRHRPGVRGAQAWSPNPKKNETSEGQWKEESIWVECLLTRRALTLTVHTVDQQSTSWAAHEVMLPRSNWSRLLGVGIKGCPTTQTNAEPTLQQLNTPTLPLEGARSRSSCFLITACHFSNNHPWNGQTVYMAKWSTSSHKITK